MLLELWFFHLVCIIKPRDTYRICMACAKLHPNTFVFFFDQIESRCGQNESFAKTMYLAFIIRKFQFEHVSPSLDKIGDLYTNQVLAMYGIIWSKKLYNISNEVYTINLYMCLMHMMYSTAHTTAYSIDDTAFKLNFCMPL